MSEKDEKKNDVPAKALSDKNAKTAVDEKAKNSESTRIAVKKDSALAEKKKKKKREAKKFPAKKLPGLLKKNFKKEKIEKKLYKKIYVSSDRDLVRSLFEENPKKPGYLYIPREKMIEKLDFKRLKLIANDVKKQKGSFKLVPFLAVVILIVAAYLAVITFKNPLLKKGLTFAMQKVFGARTDIGSVNVEFMNATITIRNLQQANKKSPMKNLFQIDKTEISFNLTEALRGKFDARNIEVSGLALDTDRTYSGALPKEAKKEKKPNPQVEAMIAEINQRKDDAINAARTSIENAFAEYNPVNMIANVQENLKSPGVAKDTQAQVEEAIARWQAKPAELKSQVDGISASTNAFVSQIDSLTKTDFSKMKDPKEIQNFGTQIKSAIDQVNDLMSQSKSMTNTVKGVVNDVQADAMRVKAISENVTDALKSDTALVKTQLDKITSFNLDTGTKILSNAVDSAMYAMIGSYYPYVVQGVNYAMELKAKASSASKEEQKKAAEEEPRHERFSGKNIYWKRDRVPTFLIENIKFSGLGVAVKGTEISSDMDKRGAPATVNGSYKQGDTRTHRGKVLVDARTKTSNHLVGLEYSGDNYPFGFSTPYLNLASNTTLSARGTVDRSGAVLINAQFDMARLALTADEFEPAIAYRFYTAALEAIDSLVLGAQIGLDANRRLVLKISSDLDQRFNTILRKIVNNELKILISEAQVQLTKILNEQCGDVMEKISEFVNIENGINAESVNMDKINALLESKKNELETKLREQAEAAIGEAKEKATSAAKDAIGDALKNANIPTVPSKGNEKSGGNTSAGNLLKGLLKK